MRKLLQVVPLVLMLAGATLIFERPAYAYADPGTGLLAVQAVGAALVTTGWYLRSKIHALFHRGIDAKSQPQEVSEAKEGDGSSCL
jgi:hypothetical protein